MSQHISEPRLLNHDSASGITEYFIWDAATSNWAIETQQDVTSLIETNLSLRNSTEKHTRYRDGIGGRVASTPLVVLMDLAKQGIVSMAGAILDEPRYRKWLNDPENLAFRTRFGRV